MTRSPGTKIPGRWMTWNVGREMPGSIMSWSKMSGYEMSGSKITRKEKSGRKNNWNDMSGIWSIEERHQLRQIARTAVKFKSPDEIESWINNVCKYLEETTSAQAMFFFNVFFSHDGTSIFLEEDIQFWKAIYYKINNF